MYADNIMKNIKYNSTLTYIVIVGLPQYQPLRKIAIVYHVHKWGIIWHCINDHVLIQVVVQK